ncbi:hypothetical protein PG996_014924 [Apiospora saccharicola]|uniref:C2H2-type domain-containing protein n=1 Tax=Apiospora saccharicola TaxID=335842 RepID=A0ABR1TJP3_9PEZI
MSSNNQQGVTVWRCRHDGCNWQCTSRQVSLRRQEWTQHGINTPWVCYQPGCSRAGFGLISEEKIATHLEGHGITKEQNARPAPQAEIPNDEASPAAAAAEPEMAEEHDEDSVGVRVVTSLLLLLREINRMKLRNPEDFERSREFYAETIEEASNLLDGIKHRMDE